MKMFVAILTLCLGFQASAIATQNIQEGSFLNDASKTKSFHHSHRHHGHSQRNSGPTGATGLTGSSGPAFGQYASYFLIGAADVPSGDNILFDTQESLAGITYNTNTGVFTLAPGTYVFNYFTLPSGNVNLVVNNNVVRNAPLSGGSVILTLSNSTNTVSLQANSTFTVESAAESTSTNASISIFQID